MLTVIATRLANAAFSLIGLVTLVFFMIFATPGGPAYSILGVHASPMAVAALNRQMGLNRPIAEQYLTWWWHLAHGNLGYSFTEHARVGVLILSYLRNTIVLYSAATLLAVVLAIAIGLFQGAMKGRLSATIIGGTQIALYSLPVFFLGTLLILVFAIDHAWLPPGGVGGATSWSGKGTLDLVRHMVLPGLTLAIPITAALSRYFGRQVRLEYDRDYVRAARSRGIPPVRLALTHVLRNALRPLVTLVGLMVPQIFVGGLLTETVFNYPGLGWLLWRSALQQDYPTLTAIVLLIGVLTILGNLAADLINSALDVETRYD